MFLNSDCATDRLLVMKTLSPAQVFALLNEHNIRYGFQTYAGGTVNVWIGENWNRKAQSNLTCDDMQTVAAWFLKTATTHFPQIAVERRFKRRA